MGRVCQALPSVRQAWWLRASLLAFDLHCPRSRHFLPRKELVQTPVAVLSQLSERCAAFVGSPLTCAMPEFCNDRRTNAAASFRAPRQTEQVEDMSLRGQAVP